MEPYIANNLRVFPNKSLKKEEHSKIKPLYHYDLHDSIDPLFWLLSQVLKNK